MPTRRLIDLLDVHLWSIRAEVELQLRRLTDLQRKLHGLPPFSDADRDAEIDRLAADVEALLEANASIRQLCVSVLDEAQALKTRGSEPPVDP